jgi:hypothetical protein
MKKYRVNISDGYQSSSDIFDSEKEALEQIKNINSCLGDLCLAGLKTSDYKVEMIIEDLKTEETAQNNDTFETQLFAKYPSLFPRDENGNLLPQSQRCWNDCPDGWRNIVDSLFGCIDNYVKHTTYTEVNPKRKLRSKMRRAYCKYVRGPIYRKLNQYQDFKMQLNGHEFTLPNKKELAKINKIFASPIRTVASIIDKKFFDIYDLYICVSPPPVVIDQYKEKYGTLRVYHSGGDDKVEGMIRYAEYLSSITCQDTGKTGQLCKRGTWYATLSNEQAEKQGYKPVE